MLYAASFKTMYSLFPSSVFGTVRLAAVTLPARWFVEEAHRMLGEGGGRDGISKTVLRTLPAPAVQNKTLFRHTPVIRIYTLKNFRPTIHLFSSHHGSSWHRNSVAVRASHSTFRDVIPSFVALGMAFRWCGCAGALSE